MRRTSLALALLLAPLATFAQTSAVPTPAPAQSTPAATAPATATPELSPKEIQRMLDKQRDWPQLERYRADNAALPPPAPGEQRVVFLGDSITDAWGRHHGKFFPGKPYINRGISGQTTPQMLVRFEADVLALHPAAVVLLAGTNDFAQNTGPEPVSAIQDNVRAMVTLARASNVRVVLCSVLPATKFNWHKGINASKDIAAYNVWLKQYAADEHLVYVDYYTPLVNAEGGMKTELSTDGFVHPNDAGYAIMEPLAQAGIDQALRKR